VYTGNFFAGRTPDGLLDALDRLSSTTPLRGVIEVVFVGQMPPGYAARITRAGLDDVVSCRGTVPFLEGLREAGNADVLLVVDAPGDAGSVFLPSKLVDYMMFRKPILGLTPAGGTAAQLLERLGCPVVPPGDPARIAAALQRLIDERGTGRLDVPPAFDAVASEYSMETAAARLDGALRAIIGRGERSARG
jgi:glycosyltransferase involved in cell wall biosynthesis